MWHCKKTNRNFNTFRGFLNHIRKEFDSIENAFLYENNLKTPPKCKYCNNNAKFISFNKGYNKICSNKDCIYKQKVDINRELANKRKKSGKYKKPEWKLKNAPIYKRVDLEDWEIFIKKNINFYRENSYRTNIIEPFTQKNIKNNKLKTFIGWYLNLKEDIICDLCNKEDKRDILEPNFNVCNLCEEKMQNKITWEKINGLELINGQLIENKALNNELWNFINTEHDRKEIKKLTSEFLKKWKITKKILTNKTLYDKNIFNIKKLYKCPVTEWIIPITRDGRILKKYLNDLELDIKDYFKKYLPENIYICKNCNKIIKINYNLSGKKRRSFCNKDCYFIYRKYNDIGNITNNSRKKQSEIVKNKIRKGEFFPQLNNRWNGEILIHDNIKFRSSWEILFYEIMKQNNIKVEYEKLIIPYYDRTKKSKRNYIIDFIDKNNKVLYEIKPNFQKEDANTKDKEKYAIKWCNENNYKFKYISENYLLKNINNEVLEKIDDNIVKLIKKGLKYEN